LARYKVGQHAVQLQYVPPPVPHDNRSLVSTTGILVCHLTEEKPVMSFDLGKIEK
jgi:hypothetical protein